MNCENCGKEHDGSYGSGRFCSSKCARGFSTREKRSLINKKVSISLTKDSYEKICPYCKEKFRSKKKKKKFCSVSCGTSYNNIKKWQDPRYYKKMSDFAKKRHLDLDPKFGWKSRNKIKPSYPESIAIRKLEEMDIDFVRELPVGKYFLDFAMKDTMIGIEIDGQQHTIENRKKTDLEKDMYLKNLGWKIYRIKFPEENIRGKLAEIFGE